MYYCSKDCQTNSWPTHRVQCKAAKKEAKAHVEDFWCAARDGETYVLRLLLKAHPAIVNAEFTQDHGFIKTGSTALAIAAAAGELDCVKILLDHGGDIRKGDINYNQLPIHRATEGGHLEVVKLLLELGSPINQPDNMGQFCLHFAAEHGHTQLCKFLLENGAGECRSIPYRGKIPKIWAMHGGHHDCAAIL